MKARITRAITRPWRLIPVALFVAVLLASAVAAARPGGGQGYSGGGGGGGGGGGWGGGGGGSRSGGGNGGGGGELLFYLVYALFRLCIEAPIVGIPLLIGVVFVGAWMAMREGGASVASDWSTGASYGTTGSVAPTVPQQFGRARIREQLDRIRAFDPDYSPVLFEDFAYALFSAAHEARGTHKLDVLAAYLQPPARAALAQLSPGATAVKGVVVGAMRFSTVSGLGPTDTRLAVRIEFECNYTETVNGRDQAYYAVEAWRFERDRTVRSKPPERARTLSCPNCGGGLENAIGGKCTYCGQVVDSGRFDWTVMSIGLERRQERGNSLTGTVDEQGTDLPSVVDPAAPTRWAELQQRDPSLDWNAVRARVGMIFSELQTAWSSQKWER
ncbi:MAG: hypothetical protein WCJ30_24430, partial [Deltaproteobacteria bacterium]